ncbi:MAG: tetratricopeptide repeat protein [Pseudomonadota bacterium]
MKSLLALGIALAVSLAGSPAPAQAQSFFEAIGSWLLGAPDIEDLPDLRKRVEKGNPEAGYLLFVSYQTVPRGGAGPRVANERVASREEAEAGLRLAADEGHADAAVALGLALHDGRAMKRDPASARLWLEKALPEANPEQRGPLLEALGENLALSPDATEADRARGLGLLDEAVTAGRPQAIRAKADVMARTDEAGQVAARDLLEKALEAGNAFARAPLGEMLARGTGGPADTQRGIGLLQKAAAEGDALGSGFLAEHLMEGTLVLRHPRKALPLMARRALDDLAVRQRLAGLLTVYRMRIEEADRLSFLLQEDEDAGKTDAAWTLLHLLQAKHEQFRDEKLMFDVLRRNEATDPRVGLVDAEYLALFSVRSKTHKDAFARRARTRIGKMCIDGLAAACTAQGRLQSKGHAYPQDDVAAAKSLLRGAELGDKEAMFALALAHFDGRGVSKDRPTGLAYLRKAAQHGSVAARTRFARQFSLDVTRRQVSLEEGVTNVVALYGDRLGNFHAQSIGSLFLTPRLRDFDMPVIATAFMDGFRLAPAGLDEDRLTPLIRTVPKPVWIAVETILKQEGHYLGATEGHVGPGTRRALREWVEAVGGLTDEWAPRP